MDTTTKTETSEQRIAGAVDKAVTGELSVVGLAGGTNIVPKNLTEIMEFAKLMATSGPCVRPAFRNKPGACLAIMMQSLRWGFDPFSVANKAYITTSRGGDEQIAFEAQLLHAVVNSRAPLVRRLRPFYDGEGAKRKCKIVGYLQGEVDALEYESPAIGSIQVQNSPLWKSDPDQQLFYYSVRAWARRHVPEVLLGAYTAEEIEQLDQHYGPEGALNITPTAPKPEREEQEIKLAVQIIAADGEIIQLNELLAIYETMLAQMEAAEKLGGMKQLEGFMETNSVVPGILREHGRADLADGIHAHFTARSEHYAAQKQAEQPKEPEKKAEPEKKEPEKKAEPAKAAAKDKDKAKASSPGLDLGEPTSPFLLPKDKRAAGWDSWVKWFLATVLKADADARTALLEKHRPEVLHIREERQADADALQAILDAKPN